MSADPAAGRKPAYRWVVLAAAAPVAAIVMGQLVNGLSVYFVPLETELGWARADIAMINSMGLAGLALGSVLMGIAADRYGVRRIALLGVLVTGLATFTASRATELWQLYALFLFAGLLGGGGISGPLTALVGSWFTRRVGLAIGIIAAAQALGQGGMPFSGALLIDGLGWRDALAVQALATLAIGLPLAALLRAPPGAAPGSPALSRESPTGMPNGRVVAWIAVGVVFCCTTMSVPLMHLVPLAQESGLQATDAGGVLFVMMMVAIAGRAFFGHVADRIGALQTWLLTSAWQTLLVFGFMMVDGSAAFYVYAIVYGFGYAGVMTSVMVTVRHLTAPARLASSLGIVLAFGYIGHGIGGWQGGFFYDMTGGYTWSYANAAIAGFVNLAVIGSLWWTINRRRRPAFA